MQFLRELLCFEDRCPIAIQIPVTDAVRSQQDSLRNSVRFQPFSVCKRDHTTRFCLCSSVSLKFLHSLPNLKCKSLWRIRSTVRSDTTSSGKFNSSDLAMIFNDQRPCCRARSLRWTRPIPELWRGRLLPGWRAMPTSFAKRCWTPRIWPREYPVRLMIVPGRTPASSRSLIITRLPSWVLPEKCSTAALVVSDFLKNKGKHCSSHSNLKPQLPQARHRRATGCSRRASLHVRDITCARIKPDHAISNDQNGVLAWSISQMVLFFVQGST